MLGANHGYHTVPLSMLVGKTGKVIACEAVSVNIDSIKYKLKIDNVDFFCAAITKPDVVNTHKEISFNYFSEGDGYSGIKRRPDVKEQEKIITVPTDTLDSIVEKANLIEKQVFRL